MVVCAAGLARAADLPVATVKGDKVNLRGRPDANGEVIGHAAFGEMLAIRTIGETWVEVVPPERVKAWVHRDFVQDGRVAVKELTVRAGPNINYPRMGALYRGETIAARETFGEWICVAPPTNSSIWVHRDFLELPAPAASAPTAPSGVTETAASNATAAIVAALPPAPNPATNPVAVAESPAPPADLMLVPLPGQGTAITREGWLKPAPYVFNPPGRFRLAQKTGSHLDTVCFLRGNNQQLASMTDTFLAIRGREYWVQGVREPVLVIEAIERKPAPVSP